MPSRQRARHRHRCGVSIDLFGLCLAFIVALWAHRVYGNQEQSTSRRQPPARRLQQASNNLSSKEHFVTIDADGDFVMGCEKFYFTGWNQWEAVEAGAGAPRLFGSVLPPNTTAPQMLREVMTSAAAAGLTVMRTWAHAVSSQYALQPSPGQYNEGIFQGLDYVLDTARQTGIKLILSLTTNWGDTGSVDQYVSWSSTADQHEDFFSDASCRQLYKSFVKTVLSRVNTINGRRYSEDPSVFAWNLVNEPRCGTCAADLQDWIEEMAAYVKQQAPNHLISVGAEGFYNAGRNLAAKNPQGTWAKAQGQDYLTNCGAPGIDFCTFHSWVDNWLDDNIDFQRTWVAEHGTDAATIGKPAVLEEFGKWVKPGTSDSLANRNAFYVAVYQQIEDSATQGGSIKGSAFWLLLAPNQTAPAADGAGGGLYGIYQGDSTFAAVSSNVQAMASLRTATTCAADPVPIAPVEECSATWVAGQPGTGFEGPSCNFNINECVRGTAQCPANAGCIDTSGGYTCACFWGYAGNAAGECLPTAQLAGLSRGYTTHGAYTLACEQGDDVPYPAGAPGFSYDPTGSHQASDADQDYGAVLPVSVFGCQLACESAPGCDSFSYNEYLQTCFLKSGPGRSACKSTNATCTEQNQQLETITFSCGSWQSYYRVAGPATAALPQAQAPLTTLAAIESAG